jgi:hypothetical protein
VKMDPDFGGDVREFMSTAAAAWNGLDALHTAFLIDSVKHPNELPVVKLTSIVEKKNGRRSIVHADVRDRRLGPAPGRHAETIAHLDERPAPTEAGAGRN